MPLLFLALSCDVSLNKSQRGCTEFFRLLPDSSTGFNELRPVERAVLIEKGRDALAYRWCWTLGLLNVPATTQRVSGTDLPRQSYMLSHWDQSQSYVLSHPDRRQSYVLSHRDRSCCSQLPPQSTHTWIVSTC